MIKTTPSSAILVYGTSNGGDVLTPLRVTEDGSVILDVVQVRANYLELTNENVIPDNSEYVHVVFDGVEQTADGWIDVGPFIRFSMLAVGKEYVTASFEGAIPDQPPVFGEGDDEFLEPDDTLPPDPVDPDARPTSFDYELPSGSTYFDIVTAVSGMAPGETLLLPSGTFIAMSPLNVPEGASIYGAEGGGTILETMGSGSDPTAIITVAANSVRLQDLTLKQKRGTNTSVESAVSVGGPGFPSLPVDNFVMVNCDIETMEIGAAVRASNFRIEGCSFAYNSPLSNSSHRFIIAYGNQGNSVIRDNVFYCSTVASLTSEAILATSSGSNETYSGCLSIVGNSQSGGTLQRFFQQNSLSGPANGFELVFKDNTFTEVNGSFLAYGAVENYADLYSHITLDGNSIAQAGKGLFGFDSPSALANARSTPLPIHIGANTLASTTLRVDYVDLYTDPGVVAHKNTLATVSVTFDTDVRPVQEPIVPEP